MNLYDKASLIITPNGYKASKLYALKPVDGSGDLTFSRASARVRRNVAGVYETLGNNIPGIDYPVGGGCPAIMIGLQRTNILLNSETLATQSVSVTNLQFTLSFEGTGTVTLSGASTAGPLVGTGVNNRVSLSFTPTAGTLTLTVTGSVKFANLEQGSFGSSWIPTTGTSATRLADDFSKTGISSLIGQVAGSILFDAVFPAIGNNFLISINDGSTANRVTLGMSATGNVATCSHTSGGVAQAAITSGSALVPGTRYKICVVWDVNYFALFLNGTKVGEDLSVTPFTASVGNLNKHNGGGAGEFAGRINALLLFPSRLTDAEAIALTT
jgi:hypothetical protein